MDEYKNKEWLHRKYIDENKSTHEIGLIVGKASGTIHYYLKKHGIKKDSVKYDRWTAEEVAILKANYAQTNREELDILLPSKTNASISAKANQLNLYKNPETLSAIQKDAQKNSNDTIDKFPNITKEFLAEQYINQRKSLRKIAKECGCSDSLIFNRVKEFNIPTRKSGDAFTDEERALMHGRSGCDNSNWKNGVTKLNPTLRKAATEWRKREIQKHGEVCFITGEEECDIHFHHEKPFYEIRDEALSELGLVKKSTVGEYTSDEIRALMALIKEKHKGVKGYPIKAELHVLFHQVYGNDVTDADIHEFKGRYLAGEFDAQPTQKEAV